MDTKGLCFRVMCVVVMVATVGATVRHHEQEHVIDNQYCSSETFDARCQRGQILLVLKAQYGRMRAGRCVSAEYGHALGCAADVTSFLYDRCSGRQNCSFVVAMFDSIAMPCPKDFKSYLEAKYKCVNVHHINQCAQKNRTELVSTQGYLSLALTPRLPALACPWVVTTDPGRRLRVRLLNFALFDTKIINTDKRTYSARGSSGGCSVHVYFKEGAHKVSVPLCEAGGSEHAVQVYTSRGHVVQIGVPSKRGEHVAQLSSIASAIFHFEVYGCKDIVPPDGASVKRSGDNAAVECNDTMETWYITCRHGNWIGDVGNCSQIPDVRDSPTLPTVRREFHNGIIIAILIGVVLGVAVGGFMLCVIYMLRKSRRRGQRNRAGTDDVHYESRMRSVDSSGSNNYPALLTHDKCTLGSRDYEHVWNMPPPQSVLCGGDSGQGCGQPVYTLDRYQKARPQNFSVVERNNEKNSEIENICLTRMKSQDSNSASSPKEVTSHGYLELSPGTACHTLPGRTEEVRVIIRDTTMVGPQCSMTSCSVQQ